MHDADAPPTVKIHHRPRGAEPVEVSVPVPVYRACERVFRDGKPMQEAIDVVTWDLNYTTHSVPWWVKCLWCHFWTMGDGDT